MEYPIGDFSKISRLGIKTLRYYHEINLLVPSRVDNLTGYRYYDEPCLYRARSIQRLKELNFSLADIREILAHSNNDRELVQVMQKKQAEVEQKLREYQKIYGQIGAFLRLAGEEAEASSGEALFKEIPDMLVISIRFRGKYEETGVHIARLFQAGGVFAAGKAFSLYYDVGPAEENADIEVCLPVLRPVSGEGIQTRRLAGGRAVCIQHRGAYEHIWKSYRAAVDYLNQHHLQPLSPSREVYLKGEDQMLPADPRQYITEIQFLY